MAEIVCTICFEHSATSRVVYFGNLEIISTLGCTWCSLHNFSYIQKLALLVAELAIFFVRGEESELRRIDRCEPVILHHHGPAAAVPLIQVVGYHV